MACWPAGNPAHRTTTAVSAVSGGEQERDGEHVRIEHETDATKPAAVQSNVVRQSATATAGYVLCGGTCPIAIVAVTLGTYLQSLSANTANQFIEIEHDRLMKRTMFRPLVTGAISKDRKSVV